jgi:hypothetical protein
LLGWFDWFVESVSQADFCWIPTIACWDSNSSPSSDCTTTPLRLRSQKYAPKKIKKTQLFCCYPHCEL